MNRYRLIYLLAVASTLLVSCEDISDSPLLAEENEELSGGVNFTTRDLSINAFGEMGKNLTSAEEGRFVTGNSFFRNNWVTAPASVASLDGLGPVLNAISCGSCHFKDGRAAPPLSENDELNGLLFRLSSPSSSDGLDPNYGGQFQDKSIPKVNPEGKVRITYQEISGQYADGVSYSLRSPSYEFYGLNYGTMAEDVQVSPRIAQQMPGLGLLENVPESTILSFADENDLNQDGISGRPNYVYSVETGERMLGRFGWKANQGSIRLQVATAFHEDMGISSSIFSGDNFSPIQFQQYGQLPNGGDPEIEDANLIKVIDYVKTLAVPIRRDWKIDKVLKGKTIFTQLDCATCHQPSMQTGSNSEIVALNNQQIRPFTDLLIHDMGEGLADHRPDGLASGTEWRTAPLWGLGMISTVNSHTFLLHDGRARNIEEAILWHGGEAENAKQGFVNLTKVDREALLAFLNSL